MALKPLSLIWPDVLNPLAPYEEDGQLAMETIPSVAVLRALIMFRDDPDAEISADDLAAECGRGPANIRRELDTLVRRGMLHRDRNLLYTLTTDEEQIGDFEHLFDCLEEDAEFRLAVSAWAFQKEIVALSEELETRRLLQQAKRVLMQTRGISEEEAHNFLLKRSRDQNMPLRDLSLMVIAGAGVRPSSPKTNAKGPAPKRPEPQRTM